MREGKKDGIGCWAFDAVEALRGDHSIDWNMKGIPRRNCTFSELPKKPIQVAPMFQIVEEHL